MVMHNLPHAATPFVNRVSEIAEITHRLNDADCRLLTLVGPGGIGKTRLAMRVAADCAEQFDDGIYFVPLHSLDSPEFIVSAIADVIRFPLNSGGDAHLQLLQYLREKALLLVLDNFEHLLDGAELLPDLLEVAPDIKLLVTSREVLNLQEEWLYPVRGLHYPETSETEQPGVYSAVQLFVERAQQVRGDLSLVNERTAIIRVCQLVEGMPLALELAAVWAKALRTDEIAVEIQRSLDFLSTSLRNVPQRHQSMQAVFEQTWGRLSDEEQRVFRALSVFSGGFRREAAEAVSGVSLRVLSGLVDKSLLTRRPDGRNQIHELLRQYAQTQLEAMPEEAFRIHDLHASYYTGFLHERSDDLNAAREREAALEIEADIDNIRAAWSWAVEHSQVDAIDKAVHPLFRFYYLQNRFFEGSNAFEKAVKMLHNGDPRTELCLAKVLCSLGWMCISGDAIEKSGAALERSWQLYSKHAVLPTPGAGSDPRVALGFIYIQQGNFSAAETLGQAAMRDHTLREDRFNLPIAYTLLAMIARLQGQYETARDYARQAYDATTTNYELSRADNLQEWGLASQLLGDTADAKRRFQAAYAIRMTIGDSEGMSASLVRLGRIALLEGNNAEARRCYEQARAICHDLGKKMGLVMSLEGMGNSACAMRHYGEAQRYLREALQIATNSEEMRYIILSLYVGIGELFLQTGRRARGIELLALVLHHPGGFQPTKDQAQRLLSRYQAIEEAAQQTLTKADFDAVTTALLDELQTSESSTLTSHTSQAEWAVIEPLSERELEILVLIADGFSNREIAEKLFLSVATVKWYLTHIYSKLGVETRTQAIVRARQINLLP